MQMDKGMKMEGIDHSEMGQSPKTPKKEGVEGMDHSKMEMPIDSTKTKEMDHSKMDIKMEPDSISPNGKYSTKKDDRMQGMDLFSEYNYDYLKSPEKTTYDEDVPVNEILLNLTGNMSR